MVVTICRSTSFVLDAHTLYRQTVLEYGWTEEHMFYCAHYLRVVHYLGTRGNKKLIKQSKLTLITNFKFLF